ncbi:MAG: hypothetical protein HYX61_12465 [Gammaproteobacteria bacterium]|jgi:hypothetical protein|nr:hypothetical protein [Gammaproteobacteria bacterium]
MEREIKSLIGMAGLFFSTSLFAMSLYDGWTFHPNIGLDVGAQKQAFETGFGEEHFREHYPQTNIYVGARIHEYFGVEVGYEHMYPLQKRQFYFDNTAVGGPNIPVLGSNLLAGSDGELYFSEAWMHGWHADLIGLWPLCKERTYLTINAGFARLQAKYETVFISNTLAATLPVRWQNDERYIARIGIGLRQMITGHFGVRVQGEWEDTSKLEATRSLDVGFNGVETPLLPTDNYTVKPKDSYSVSLGFFWEFI